MGDGWFLAEFGDRITDNDHLAEAGGRMNGTHSNETFEAAMRLKCRLDVYVRNTVPVCEKKSRVIWLQRFSGQNDAKPGLRFEPGFCERDVPADAIGRIGEIGAYDFSLVTETEDESSETIRGIG